VCIVVLVRFRLTVNATVMLLRLVVCIVVLVRFHLTVNATVMSVCICAYVMSLVGSVYSSVSACGVLSVRSVCMQCVNVCFRLRVSV
jgi:hypothetical protein